MTDVALSDELRPAVTGIGKANLLASLLWAETKAGGQSSIKTIFESLQRQAIKKQAIQKKIQKAHRK